MSVCMVSVYSRDWQLFLSFIGERKVLPSPPLFLSFFFLHLVLVPSIPLPSSGCLCQRPLPLSSLNRISFRFFHSKESIWTEKEQAVHLSALFQLSLSHQILCFWKQISNLRRDDKVSFFAWTKPLSTGIICSSLSAGGDPGDKVKPRNAVNFASYLGLPSANILTYFCWLKLKHSLLIFLFLYNGTKL